MIIKTSESSLSVVENIISARVVRTVEILDDDDGNTVDNYTLRIETMVNGLLKTLDIIDSYSEEEVLDKFDALYEAMAAGEQAVDIS